MNKKSASNLLSLSANAVRPYELPIKRARLAEPSLSQLPVSSAQDDNFTSNQLYKEPTSPLPIKFN